MADNFGHAAELHRRDAKKLAAHSCHQTAGHLIGFAAECLVKAVLTRAGEPTDRASGLRCHFPALKAEIRKKGSNRIMIQLSHMLPDSFLDGWTAELRYEPDIDAAKAEERWCRWHSDVQTLFHQFGRP